MPSTLAIQPVSDDPAARYNLVFYLTGNPGLISYYNSFLVTLHDLLSTSQESRDLELYHVFGQNLLGFENDDTPSKITNLPHDLESQIEDRLHCLKGQRIPSGPRQGEEYDNVILMGHSVGAYMLLEILRRLRKTSEPPTNIKGAILLMPTVMGLAESPSGVKFSSLFAIPGFAWVVGVAGKTLVWPLSKGMAQWTIKKALGMSEEGSAVTTRFLKSSMGIWQALHLAKDEMKHITVDKWDDDVWGVEHEDSERKSDVPKLVFYFAEEDHWVANHTRDALIAARGKPEGDLSSSKPKMVIDSNGVGHAFCIHHSEFVAEKAKLWVEEILAS